MHRQIRIGNLPVIRHQKSFPWKNLSIKKMIDVIKADSVSRTRMCLFGQIDDQGCNCGSLKAVSACAADRCRSAHASYTHSPHESGKNYPFVLSSSQSGESAYLLPVQLNEPPNPGTGTLRSSRRFLFRSLLE